MSILNYVELSQRIFNELNGKINIRNTNIILEIDDELKTNGCLYLRSKLILNLKKIIDNLSDCEYLIPTNILFIICHELYHADQMIIDKEYLNNENYMRTKETEADYQAISFILGNLEILQKTFNIYIDRFALIDKEHEIKSRFDISYQRSKMEDIIRQHITTLTGDKRPTLNKENVMIHLYNINFSDYIIVKYNNEFNNCIDQLQYYLRNYYNNIIQIQYSYYEEGVIIHMCLKNNINIIK